MPPYRNPRAPQKSREELKAQAEAALARFQEQGRTVDQVAAVVATSFACKNCGHTGVIGVREGQRIRCPKCREFCN